jgi:predicted GNAT family acetyltransferase
MIATQFIKDMLTTQSKPKVRIIAHTHSRDFLGWVAMTEDDKAVGWVNLTFQKDKVIKLQDAFVLEEFRGHGIYNMLWEARMQWVEEHYTGRGYVIESWCKDTSLHQFVKKGFKIGERATRVTKEI